MIRNINEFLAQKIAERRRQGLCVVIQDREGNRHVLYPKDGATKAAWIRGYQRKGYIITEEQHELSLDPTPHTEDCTMVGQEDDPRDQTRETRRADSTGLSRRFSAHDRQR